MRGSHVEALEPGVSGVFGLAQGEVAAEGFEESEHLKVGHPDLFLYFFDDYQSYGIGGSLW
jgi:hypothetical protein